MRVLFILLCFHYLLLAASTEDWTTELNKAVDGVEKIKNFMNGDNKGKSYRRLAFATDTYGPRLAGSVGLERAIDLLKRDSANTSLDVKEEKVMVTSWQEVSSSATFHSKIRNKSLAIVAYGPSVPGKLTAPVLLVKSFDELDNRASEAVGKIVVYNQECQDYPTCVQYRNDGASRAAEHGAVASLTRSIAFFSIYTSHTGPVMYKDKKIPAAAITIEDAAFIERIMKRDPSATIDLHINTVTGEERESSNLIIDIPGTDLKNEILLAGTHTDSWHVDDGVSNNAVGCNMLYEAMRAIKKLGLKPRRTLRLALWTAGVTSSSNCLLFAKPLNCVSELIEHNCRNKILKGKGNTLPKRYENRSSICPCETIQNPHYDYDVRFNQSQFLKKYSSKNVSASKVNVEICGLSQTYLHTLTPEVADRLRWLPKILKDGAFDKAHVIIKLLKKMMLKDELSSFVLYSYNGIKDNSTSYISLKSYSDDVSNFPSLLQFTFSAEEEPFVVGVHVRMGDFLLASEVDYGLTVADGEYFQHSFEYFIKARRKIVFVVLSDDMNWVTNHFQDYFQTENSTSSTFNKSDIKIVFFRDTLPQDFAFLCRSDGLVISTGTFGWWAGWFNSRATVIYYDDYPKNNSKLGKRLDKKKYYIKRWIPML